jgi:putative ABC transport system permease protein
MIGTDFKLAKASLKSSKVRSLMTMIAVIIGVMSFMLITTFIDGFKQTLESEFNEFGGNLVAVNPCNLDVRDENFELIEFDFVKSVTCSIRLSMDDYNDLAAIDGVKSAAPMLILETNVKVARTGDEILGALVVSTNAQYPEAFNQKVKLGNFYSDDETANQVVIGHGVSESQFNGSGLGSQLIIGGEKYTIVGIMDKYSLSFSGGGSADFDNIIIVPLAAGNKLNNGILGFAEIDVQLELDVNAQEYLHKAQTALLENYNGEDVFSVATQEESLDVVDNVLGYAKTVSQVVSYVMLFVGGTVIALIMLVTVKERTREIGVRKSIGATNRNILSQFVMEAILISWVGSLIGVALAYLIGLYIAGVSEITPVYTLNTVLAVVIISTIIGALSGLAPAFIAARKDPVEALRDQ